MKNNPNNKNPKSEIATIIMNNSNQLDQAANRNRAGRILIHNFPELDENNKPIYRLCRQPVPVNKELISQELEEKSLKRSVGRLAQRAMPSRGRRRGRAGRRVIIDARFDPNARDGDNDGIVQEMTRWERPATPRMNMRVTVDDDGETDVEALLESLQSGRRQDAPQRLMGGDDVEVPKPRRDARGRDRLGLDRPRSDVTEDTYKGPKTIIPITPGKPMTTVIKGMSKSDWDDMVYDLRSYFADMQLELDPKDKKLKALFQLMDAIKKVKAKDGDDGLELDGTDEHFKRIGTSLRAIKNQGNDNIRNLETVRDAMKETRKRLSTQGEIFKNRSINARRLMPTDNKVTELQLPNFDDRFFQGVRDRDSQIAAATLKNIIKDVEGKYGKITTKKDAIDALNKAHPNIVKNFKFLYTKRTPAELTPVQRGLVYGYLQVLDSSDVLQKYNLEFTRQPGIQNGGGATRFGFAWFVKNDNGDTYGKTQVIFEFSNPDSDALVSGTAGSSKMDGIPNQIAISYMKNNPDNLSERDLIDAGGFIDAALTAVHEGGHAHNILKAMEVIFGEDTVRNNPDKFRKLIEDMLSDPDQRKLLIRPQVNKFAYDLLNIVHKIEALEIYKQEISDHVDALAINEAQRLGESNIARFKAMHADILWRTSVENYEKMYRLYDAFQKDEISLGYLLSIYPNGSSDPSRLLGIMQEAYIVRNQIDQRFTPQEGALLKKKDGIDINESLDLLNSIWDQATRSEAKLSTFINNEKIKHEQILRLSSSQKYQKLNNELHELFRNEKSKWFTAWRRASSNNEAKKIAELKAKHEKERNKILMRLLRDEPELFEEFARDLMNTIYGPGSSDRFDEVANYNDASIIYAAIRSKITDDLTTEERASFREWTESLSDYGSKTIYSFYGNIQEGVPVEGVAETSAALIAGILPEKGTPQWDAVRKLTIWNYGIAFWNKVLGERND